MMFAFSRCYIYFVILKLRKKASMMGKKNEYLWKERKLGTAGSRNENKSLINVTAVGWWQKILECKF